jgi:colicin import membrane protein
MSENTELLIIEDISEDRWPSVFGQNSLKQFSDKVREVVSKQIPELDSLDGRKAIASLAAKVSSSKIAVEKPGRAYLKKIKELPKTIEDELREFVKEMDLLRDETRKPLTHWEAEQAAIEAKRLADEAAKALAIQIASDHEIALLMYADYLRKLEEKFRADAQEKIEYEQRIAAEAAAKATRDAEEKAAQVQREHDMAVEKAKREKIEAEMREARVIADAKEAARKAEIDAARKQAEAVEAERVRNENEKLRLERIKRDEVLAQEKAARNKEHQKKINNAILASLVEFGLSEENSKLLISKIAKEKIPYVSINY